MFPTALRRATLAGSLLVCAAFAPGLADCAAAAALAPAPQLAADSSHPAQAAANAEHVALRDAIWRLDRLLRRHLDVASNGAPVALDDGAPKLKQLAEILDVLRHSGHRLGDNGRILVEKANALELLLREVEQRATADAVPSSLSPWRVAFASPTTIPPGLAATCTAALPVTDGQFVGAVLPAANGGAGEIWLRYTAAKSGVAVVNTAGSDFDTEIEVYGGCPSTGSRPTEHADDEIGLQARGSFHTTEGETSWIRIAGADGAFGSLLLELAGGLAGFQGVVTNEATGQPVDAASVRVWSATGSFMTSSDADADGGYLVGLPPGTYLMSTSNSVGLLDELDADLPCPGGAPLGCSPTAGTPISLAVASVPRAIDFRLAAGASVAGRVRDASTGAMLDDLYVEVYNQAGVQVAHSFTDAAGRFLISGLSTGVVYVTAGVSYGPYRREVYQNVGCTPTCDVTTGTPVQVTDGQTTPGVDFALEHVGGISGRLTRLATGDPVGFYAYVTIFNSRGEEVSSSYAYGTGEYSSGALDAGQYFATTQTFGAYLDELYDDLPCDPGCDPTAGTPISVTLGNVTTGIDFALRRMGTISGALTDAVTGDPLGSFFYSPARITVFNASGASLGERYTSFDGYMVTGLPAGTYYLKATHPDYRGEVYDDLPCPSSCDPTAGTPISVTIDTDTTGVDFALTPLGSIAGTLTDADSSAPILATVRVWSSTGQLVKETTTYGGTYKIPGLSNGNYFVTAMSADYAAELFDDIPCPGGPPAGCMPTSGTVVAATLGTTTTGIDFALRRRGRIAGTVKDAASLQPLSWSSVWVFNGSGRPVASAQTDFNGDYQVDALDAGNYFVVADAQANGYDAELYDGLPCANAACDPTIGTPVAVALAATTAGIDFMLSPSNVITGIVKSPWETPLPGADVELYDVSGMSRGNAYTDQQGRFALPAEPGTWYLVASGYSQYATQLYSGIACSNGCDVTTGTPIVLTEGVDTPNIDFTLSFASGITGRVTDAGHPLPGVAIDLWDAFNRQHLASAVTAGNGTYHFEPAPGTYLVSTDTGMGALEEIWNNVPCPLGPAYQGLCDLTAGTPIAVPSWEALVAGIDFDLDGVELFVNGFEPGASNWSGWTP